MKRTLLAAVAAATLISLPLVSSAAAADSSEATIDLSGGTIAAGVGIDWGKGTLHFEGQDVPFKVKGLSIARVAAASISATGNVYNLARVSDFVGNYSAISAGAAVAGGAGVIAMKNEHGVVIQLHSTTVGVDLDLGVKGLQVRFAQ